MKVLLIGPLPAPINGCSYANQTLVKNLKQRRISCSYINTSTADISGVQGHKFSIAKAFSFIKTYFRIHKVFSASVVYVTPGQTFFGVCKYAPFLLLCRFFRKPYIIHLHGNYLGKEYAILKGIKKRIFGFLVSGASAGIVLSPSLRTNFKNLLPENKIFIVENFVDDYFLQPLLGKDRTKLRILYLSNLMREKGILELMEGLLLLKNKNIEFDITVAGAMEKGIEEEFKVCCKTLGNQIKYMGTVTGDKKRKVLTEANVFILPTYYKMEGQPICLLEGMAAGNIIITTAHAGIPDVVTEDNGFFVKERSPEGLASCLEKISLQLCCMVNRFSAHNIKYASDNFTEKVFTDKVVTILYAIAKS